jgi:hypothetical protein
VIEFLESRKVVATSGKRARKVIRPTSYPRPADAFMALFAILSARVAVTSPLWNHPLCSCVSITLPASS